MPKTAYNQFNLTMPLEHIPNSDPPAVQVISDNGVYSPYERSADEISIIGRICWFAREI